MKYFYGHTTTKYDGMEWGQDFVVKAKTVEEGQQKAEQEDDWVHDEDVEEVDSIHLQEIPEAHYNVLAQYVVVVE